MTPSSGFNWDPQTLALLQQMQNQQAQGSWAELMGLVYPQGSTPPVGSATQKTAEDIGYYTMPNGTQVPTLAGTNQQAQLSGLYNGNALPTLSGFITNPDGSKTATTAEQGIQSGVINNIMSANNSPANPFTYLSKLQGIGNMGSVGDFARNSIMGASGQSLDQLRNSPTYLNSQIAPSIYSGLFTGAQPTPGSPAAAAQPQLPTRQVEQAPAASQVTGGVSALLPYMALLHQSKPGNPETAMPTADQPGGSDENNFLSTIMSYLHNSKPTAIPQYDGSGKLTGFAPPPQTGGAQSANALSAALPNLTAGSGSRPVNTINGGGPNASAAAQAALPTGYGTSQQQFNKLVSPSLQGAFMDAVQAGGGQNPQDFQAGMKAAAPNFTRSANAQIGNLGRYF